MSRITSALVNWDARQAKRDKHHNFRFLAIALQAIDSAKEDSPNATEREIAEMALNGRCLDYVLKFIAEHPESQPK